MSRAALSVSGETSEASPVPAVATEAPFDRIKRLFHAALVAQHAVLAHWRAHPPEDEACAECHGALRRWQRARREVDAATADYFDAPGGAG